ncbi:hypothetical protein CsSME_00027455 [Camellia sinensis var. sinensis]
MLENTFQVMLIFSEGQIDCLFFQTFVVQILVLTLERAFLSSSGHSCARVGFTNFAPLLKRSFLRSSRICHFSAFLL